MGHKNPLGKLQNTKTPTPTPALALHLIGDFIPILHPLCPFLCILSKRFALISR